MSWWGQPAKTSLHDGQHRERLLHEIRKAEGILLEGGMTIPDVLRVIATAIDFSHKSFDKLKSLGSLDDGSWGSWGAYVTLQASIKFNWRDSNGVGGGICQRYILQLLPRKLSSTLQSSDRRSLCWRIPFF